MAQESKAPHLTFLINSPTGGVKDFVFGPVGNEGGPACDYAFAIIIKHARDIAHLYQVCGWHA